MTISWWTLGLQAVNVLILVWLLSRVFWQPVAAAIAARQATAMTMLSDAETTQEKADSALAEVVSIRTGLDSEREAMLAEAGQAASTAAKAKLAEAEQKAEKVLSAAKAEREHATEAASTKAAAEAAELAVDIARKLLARLDASTVQDVFLGHLAEAINQMTTIEKTTLVATTGGIDVVTAGAMDAAARAQVETALATALDGEPDFNFLIDPELIAGFELRTAHFVLHDSWQSDLAAILKGLKHAA